MKSVVRAPLVSRMKIRIIAVAMIVGTNLATTNKRVIVAIVETVAIGTMTIQRPAKRTCQRAIPKTARKKAASAVAVVNAAAAAGAADRVMLKTRYKQRPKNRPHQTPLQKNNLPRIVINPRSPQMQQFLIFPLTPASIAKTQSRRLLRLLKNRLSSPLKKRHPRSPAAVVAVASPRRKKHPTQRKQQNLPIPLRRKPPLPRLRNHQLQKNLRPIL
jgi:hypothetical protein